MLQQLKGALGSVKQKMVVLFTLLVAAFVGAPAFAQTGPTFDTSGIISTITAVGAAAALVGAAYVAMRIGVKAWKWLTGAA